MAGMARALMSVRELIAELSEIEETLRRSRSPALEAGGAAAHDVDVRELVRREQLIIHELRRRARARSFSIWASVRIEALSSVPP